MQNDEASPLDTNRAPGSNHNDSSGRVQLSANMMRRLEELEEWRISPSLIKFPNGGPESHGGFATVSRALLDSSPGDARGQVVESSGRNPKSNDRTPKSEGDNECGEAKGRNEEVEHRDEEAAGGPEQEFNDETSGRWKAVAVKKMRVDISDGIARVLGLTVREAEFLVGLSHENVITLEGFVEDVSRRMIWLVFPWEDNGTLKAFLASVDWEIPERISLIRDVSQGLEYLHSRKPPICHSDLKAINILVNSNWRAVITDFGSALHPAAKSLGKEREPASKEPQPAPSLEATHCPSTNTITLTSKKYTLRWAAPELLEEEDANLASDIWAFGCVVYEVMTNSVPFQDVKDVMVVRRVLKGDLPSISSEARMLLIQALCSFVGRCWNIDPSTRPTAEECRTTVSWMPMIVPNPARTEDAAASVNHYPELLMKLGYMHRRQSDCSNASKYFAKALGVYTDISDSKGKADALWGLAEVHRMQSEYNQAVTLYSECLQIRIDIGDRGGRAQALSSLASVHRAREEYSQAVLLYSECLPIYIDLDDRQMEASVLSGLAEIARLAQEFSRAVMLYSESLKIYNDIGERLGKASALFGLAVSHHIQGQDSQAVEFYSECLQIRTDMGDKFGRAEALAGLATMHSMQKEYSQAVTFYSECLQIRTDIGDRQGRAETLLCLAEVHRSQKEYSQAMAFLSEALTVFTDMDSRSRQALTLWKIADTHRDQDDHSSAIRHYEQAAEIFKQSGDTLIEAAALSRAADMRRLMEQKRAT